VGADGSVGEDGEGVGVVGRAFEVARAGVGGRRCRTGVAGTGVGRADVGVPELRPVRLPLIPGSVVRQGNGVVYAELVRGQQQVVRLGSAIGAVIDNRGGHAGSGAVNRVG